MPEVTEQYVRLPVKKPEGSAQIRTMSLDQAKGIWALYDKANGEIVTYLFRTDKDWDMAKAKAWVARKAGGQGRAQAMGRRMGWDGEGALRAVFQASGDVQLFDDGTDERFEGEHLEHVEFMASDGKALALQHVERDDEGVPTAIRLLEFGKWDIPKYGGDLVVDEATGAGTLEYQAWRGMEQLLVDRDHKSKIPIGAGGSTKARGWWTPEVRGDGIWATEIKWAQETYDELKAGAWRYFSPTGGFNTKTKHVDFLDTFALTNDPATLGQMPLTATLSSGTPAPTETTPPSGAPAPAQEEPKMKELLKKLGLKEDATEEDALKALETVQAEAAKVEASEKEVTDLKASMEADKAKDSDEVEALRAFKASTLEACELKDDADDKAVLAYVSTLQAKAPEADKAAKLESKVAELEKFREDTRISTLMASVEDYTTPENRERVEKLARTLDEELFVATVQAWPKVKGDTPTPISDKKLEDRNDATDEELLTKEDRDLIAARGWDKDSEDYKQFVAIRREEMNLP